MTYTDRHIVDSYSLIFNRLSTDTRKELIHRLTISLKMELPKNDSFYESFGAFSDEKSAEEIIFDIKESRKFRNKQIEF